MLELPLILQQHMPPDFHTQTNLRAISSESHIPTNEVGNFYDKNKEFKRSSFGFSEDNHAYDSTIRTPQFNIPKASPLPLLVSTPNFEESFKNQTENLSNVLVKKTNRVSRLYTSACSLEQFESLVVDSTLLDYLVRNGAISQSMSQKILDSPSSNKRAMLLKMLGFPVTASCASDDSVRSGCSNFATGLALLINALRHTGHHSLASQLDVGRRITPSPGVCNGELTSQSEKSWFDIRRRGQLSLWIELEAIKVDPNVYQELSEKLDVQKFNNDNERKAEKSSNGAVPASISQSHDPRLPSFVQGLDSVCCTHDLAKASAKRQDVHRPSSVWIDHEASNPPATTEHSTNAPPSPVVNKTKEPTGCFSKLLHLFRRRKRQKSTNRVGHALFNEEKQSLDIVKHPPSPKLNGTLSHSPTDTKRDQLLTIKLNFLNSKSNEFYNLLLDHDSRLYESLVKYFEQSCGVLVLDCSLKPPAFPKDGTSALSLCLIIVATQTERIKRLWSASTEHANHSTQPLGPGSGSVLEKELTAALISAGVLDKLQVQDLRLSVHLDHSEAQLAVNELIDSIE